MPSRAALRIDASLFRNSAGLAAVVALTMLVPACGGGGSDGEPRVLEAGQVDAKLPAGYRGRERRGCGRAPRRARRHGRRRRPGPHRRRFRPVRRHDTRRPRRSSVPIKKTTDAVQDLIAASGRFRDCLNDLNVKFIGAPDPNNPQSPTNDPDYLESLGTCAARSNIIQFVEAARAEQDTWSPKEIKRQNEGYLLWRDCMVKRGWKIEKPTPDEKGRLFVISTSSKPPEPPPGKDFFNSKDQGKCATQAQREYRKKHPGASLNP